MAPTNNPQSNTPGFIDQLTHFLFGQGPLAQAAGQNPSGPPSMSPGLANGLGSIGRGLGALTGNTPAAQQNNTYMQKAVDDYMSKNPRLPKVSIPVTKKKSASTKMKPNEILAAPKE